MLESDRSDLPLQLRSPVLQRLFDEEGPRLHPALERRELAPGETLCTLDTPPEGLFLILSGEISVSRPMAARGFLPVESLRAGDAVGAEPAGLTSSAAPGVTAPGAGGPGPRHHEAPRFEARAVTKATVLLLPRARIEQLATEVPALAVALAEAAEIDAMKRPFLAAMRRVPAFRSASLRQIARLFSAAEPIAVAAGATVVRQGDPPSGFYLVVEGELTAAQRSRAAAAGDPEPRTPADANALVHGLHLGDLFGHHALITGEEPATVTAAGRARLLRVPAESYERLLGMSTSFRRRIGHRAGAAGGPPSRAPGVVPAHTVEVFLLQSDVQGAPLGVLTDLLGQALASDHGDEVLVLELAAPGDPPRGEDRDAQIASLARARITVPDGPGAAEAVEAALLELGGGRDRVFLDASGRGDAFAAALAPVISEQHGRAVRGRSLTRGKVVLLSRDPLAQRLPEALRAVPVISTALVGGVARPELGSFGVVRERAYPSATARVRLDLAAITALGRPGEVRLAALPSPTRASISRWARSITDRTVGVALGGGGAWGYAHVPLLRAMHDAGVPVDMVSGTSFGALAGAFYCAAGLEGLDRLLAAGDRANAATARSFFSSRALEHFIDRELGVQRLEDLEVPLFPVATDLVTGAEIVITVGTLGAGVRASGAFPGMFTPVTGGGAYVVDGGFINNVPASVLAGEGADLIVASNIVAAPPVMAPGEPLFRGPFGRLLHEFNPLTRPLDLIRAGFVMMHTNGERESEFADVVFESDPIELAPSERRTLRDKLFRGKVPFWDFMLGPQVAARAAPKARLTVEQIRAQWQQLSRGSRLP
ncbi:MAG: cyclic nucleotide-binding domain-containing protein [Polyangiaceae bacterium]|nr:cyclic nucleotide-binding domain-containing protein [Polyangiaceae bacterium]